MNIMLFTSFYSYGENREEDEDYIIKINQENNINDGNHLGNLSLDVIPGEGSILECNSELYLIVNRFVKYSSTQGKKIIICMVEPINNSIMGGYDYLNEANIYNALSSFNSYTRKQKINNILF